MLTPTQEPPATEPFGLNPTKYTYGYGNLLGWINIVGGTLISIKSSQLLSEDILYGALRGGGHQEIEIALLVIGTLKTIAGLLILKKERLGWLLATILGIPVIAWIINWIYWKRREPSVEPSRTTSWECAMLGGVATSLILSVIVAKPYFKALSLRREHENVVMAIPTSYRTDKEISVDAALGILTPQAANTAREALQHAPTHEDAHESAHGDPREPAHAQ
jgi:hypothetical protein